jgi:hypothetical protein
MAALAIEGKVVSCGEALETEKGCIMLQMAGQQFFIGCLRYVIYI